MLGRSLLTVSVAWRTLFDSTRLLNYIKHTMHKCQGTPRMKQTFWHIVIVHLLHSMNTMARLTTDVVQLQHISIVFQWHGTPLSNLTTNGVCSGHQCSRLAIMWTHSMLTITRLGRCVCARVRTASPEGRCACVWRPKRFKRRKFNEMWHGASAAAALEQ